jgi:hypothetical protein
MTMTTVNRQIDNLLRDAVVAAAKLDPDKLHDIARILNRLGDWEDGSLVENKAKEVERRLAEAIS